MSSKYVEILSFKLFEPHVSFSSKGDKIRNKVVIDHYEVSVLIELECGDMLNNLLE